MSRTLTTDVKTELSAQSNRPAFLYEGVFTSSTIRLWTRNKDVTFDGETYQGNGWLYRIRTPAENDDLSAQGMVITLNGVPPTIISLILNNSDHSGTGKLWMVMLDSSGDIIDDAYLLFQGRLDEPKIRDTGNLATVDIPYESELVSLRRRREHRYTNEGQRLFYADDAGFEYVVQAQKWTGYWGKGENPLNIRRRDRR